MYGMINEAVRALIVEKGGADAWEKICKEAGLSETRFASLQTYPDEMTYRLVGAVSKVLGLPAEQVLETFGEYWTKFAQETTFARLMNFAGHSFVDFIANLDRMHTKIKLTLPELTPPSFRVSDASDGRFVLHYRSTRRGLAPLVKGMMKGIASIYGMTIEVTELGRHEGEGDCVDFEVRYHAAAAAAE